MPATPRPRHTSGDTAEGPAAHGVAGAELTDVAVKRRIVGGGIQVGSGMAGFAAALGTYVVVASVVAAVVTRIGTTSAIHIGDALVTARIQQVQVVSWGGAIALLVLAFLAFVVGGYVAGTMARTTGLLEGVNVWFWGAVAAVVASLIVVFSSSDYAVLYQFDLFPRIHLDAMTGTSTAVVSAIIFAAGGLLGAIIGGVAGAASHRRVVVAEPTTRPRP